MSNRMKVSQLSQHPSCPAPTRPDLSSECERFKRTASSCTSSSFSIDITVDSRNSSTYGNCLRLDSSSGHQKQPQSQSNQAQPHRTPSQRPPETQTTKPPKRPQESSLGSPIELASNVTCSATAMSDSHVQQGKSTPTSHNCLSSDIAVCRIPDASPNASASTVHLTKSQLDLDLLSTQFFQRTQASHTSTKQEHPSLVVLSFKLGMLHLKIGFHPRLALPCAPD